MIPQKLPQGYYTKSGTVLLRKDSSKEGLSLLLFLRSFGPRWVSAPSGSGKNRFGGAAEPLIWGEFSLYQSPSRLYLQSVAVKEDFLTLRKTPGPLITAMKLYRLVSDEAPRDCENDALLRLIWSTMLQLCEGCPPQIVEFRFAWRFLNNMGVAPSLDLCSECGAKLVNGGYITPQGVFCERCARGTGGFLPPALLSELRTAAGLAHEKFIQWSREPRPLDGYKESFKKLSPYFRNMR
ncbi:MAG: DNA repair protein RecO C-terminal domain-containing protein [Synergistes sp.]|nr:DNA repair protein RecO C-terminal domain-containing protein [Synergistes sp.]